MQLVSVVAATVLPNSTFAFSFQPSTVGEHTMAVELGAGRVGGQLYGFTTRLARAVGVASVRHHSTRQIG
jgi:hypothetical protein